MILRRGHTTIYASMLILFGITIYFGGQQLNATATRVANLERALDAVASTTGQELGAVNRRVGALEGRAADVEKRTGAIEAKEAQAAAQPTFGDKAKAMFGAGGTFWQTPGTITPIGGVIGK